MTIPEVISIDATGVLSGAGRPIVVQAQDDCGVCRISVLITTVEHEPIEGGDALADEARNTWTYKTQSQLAPCQTILIQATAMDQPGNTARKSVFWWVP